MESGDYSSAAPIDQHQTDPETGVILGWMIMKPWIEANDPELRRYGSNGMFTMHMDIMRTAMRPNGVIETKIYPEGSCLEEGYIDADHDVLLGAHMMDIAAHISGRAPCEYSHSPGIGRKKMMTFPQMFERYPSGDDEGSIICLGDRAKKKLSYYSEQQNQQINEVLSEITWTMDEWASYQDHTHGQIQQFKYKG